MKMLTYADLHPAYVIINRGHRPLLLDSLHQYRTYGALLMGLPERSRVRQHIESARSQATRQLHAPVPVHLIEPALVPFKEARRTVRIDPGSQEPVPEGEPVDVAGERLPLVTCIAEFDCPEPLAEPAGLAGTLCTYSTLGLLWFQERLAPPIDPAVLHELQTFDWAALAVDVSD